MNQNQKDKPGQERDEEDGSRQVAVVPKQAKQDQKDRGERGGQFGSGDAREQQEQEEFDRGGQRHGQHSR